ncbi:hypothetical protein GP486_007612 [Trichoglossum hirsutum]|uniref:Uncharacterized protein n=1 Tax=Trichoglossum hirsutum TaxID=265104 RepID=A0A9P8L6R6_9PEZI|nr:hypothetical protein GP486_007612 [Trichoglossum hirsutum]
MATTQTTAAGGKTVRAKKGSASKLSLASTQSANWTTFSANSSFADIPLEDGDSIASTAMRLTAKGKKAAATRGKNTRAKKNEPVELSSFMEPEDDSFDVKVLEKPTRATRGRKRSSAEMNADDHKNERQCSVDTVTEAPPAKRRTRTRSSLAQPQNLPPTASAVAPRDVVMTDADDAAPVGAAKRGGKGKRTRNSNAKPRGRKISAASTASIASVRMEIDVPDDDEIDRALEADLDRPLTDDEADDVEIEEVPKKRRLTRTRATSTKVVASTAPVRRAARASKMADEEDIEMGDAAADVMESKTQPEPETSKPKATATRGRQTRKASAKQKPEPRSKPSTAEETRSDVQASTLEEGKMQERADERSLLDSSITLDITSPPPITRPKRATNRKPSRQMAKRSTRASAMSTADSHALSSPQTNHLALDADSNPGYESADSMASQATVRRGGTRQRGSSITGKKGKGVKNGVMGSRHIEDIVQGRIEAASGPKEDKVMEEGRPKRGKKGDTNVNERKAEDPQIDVDKADASIEATAPAAARPLPDIPTVKAAKNGGARKETAQPTTKPLPDVPTIGAAKRKDARKETVAKKANSASPDEAEQAEAAAVALARDGPRLAPAAPAEPLQSKAVRGGKSTASAKGKVTTTITTTTTSPSSPRTTTTLPVEGEQQEQQGQREELQQLTPDPSNASDAENQPPSSQPPTSTSFRSHTTRIPLAASTPSKRNVTTSLQTSFPWTAADLETVFLPSPSPVREGGEHEDIDKENRRIRTPLDMMKGLTSPEKRMTVEEWIGFNAKREEERLRAECERRVGVFERIGNLAMRSLEEIEVVE